MGGGSGSGSGPVTHADEKPERALEALAGLPTRELLGSADAQRRRLAVLLCSQDPLVSYRAASLLVQATRRPADWPAEEAWVRQTLAAVDSDAATPRGLCNFLEACRRLVASVASVAADSEGDEDVEAEAEEIGDRRGGLLAVVADALPLLQSAVIRLMDDAPVGSEEAEGELELSLVWILKLAQALLQASFAVVDSSLPALPGALAALCNATWEAAGRRALRRGLVFSCSGLVAARQQALKLALAMLEEEASELLLPWDGLALLIRCHVEETPAAIPDVEEAEQSADPEQACSLVRAPRSSDLLPYRLALLIKALRRVGQAAIRGDAEAWPLLLALLNYPLRLQFVAGPTRADEEDEEEGLGLSSPLVGALLDHDDLLFGALNDLQCLCIALRTAPAPIEGATPEAQALLNDFVHAASPPLLFASLLEVVDEELLLEFLVSNETRALEYVMRAVKFLIWLLEKGRRGGGGDDDDGDEGETVGEVGAFLVELGGRLQGLVGRGLFPYNIGPLVRATYGLKHALRLAPAVEESKSNSSSRRRRRGAHGPAG